MPTASVYESTLEHVALSWFADLGYAVRRGEEIALGEPSAERDAYDQVVLLGRLRDAVDRLNPKIPAEAREEAVRKVLRSKSPSLVANNRKFHAMLRDGVEIEYRRQDGSIAGDRVRLLDYDDPDNNDWLVVNQFTVVEAGHNRRPDVVVFINGLPLAVFELKNPADEDATIWTASRATTNCMRFKKRLTRPSWRRGRTGTGAAAWSGTRRDRARACPCCSMLGRSFCTRP